MRDFQIPAFQGRAKMLTVVVGGSALVALGAFSVAYGPDSGSSVVAGGGSGDSAVGTTYVQPAPGAMNVGATATDAPPASTLATSMAVPPIPAA